jgi:hypothetical protein
VKRVADVFALVNTVEEIFHDAPPDKAAHFIRGLSRSGWMMLATAAGVQPATPTIRALVIAHLEIKASDYPTV